MSPKKRRDPNVIRNFYETKDAKEFINNVNNPNEKYTDIAYGSRVLVIGPSGSSKTNMLCNFLENSPGSFHKAIFLVKMKEEPLYAMLQKKFKNQNVIFTNKISDISLDDKSPMFIRKDLDKNEQLLLVIDDFMQTAKNDKSTSKLVEELFLRGRKMSCTLFMIQQSYISTSLDCRRNASHLIILKIPQNRDKNYILKEALPMVSDAKNFSKLFDFITQKQLDFMKIHMLSRDKNKTVSRNFTDFVPYELLTS
jgi:hypothetical protein